MFDKLLLLARGRTMFFGPTRMSISTENSSKTLTSHTDDLDAYLSDELGHPVPRYANPADHALDIFNTDFMGDPSQREAHIDEYARRWSEYTEARGLAVHSEGDKDEHETLADPDRAPLSISLKFSGKESLFRGMVRDLHRTGILMERNAINYSRNLLAYGVRIGMYRECRCTLRVS